jgi:ribosomal-protein-serine acetyltransferase
MNPILLDIPGEISTERISMRTPHAGDGSIVAATVLDSLAELKVWMPWATDKYDGIAGEDWSRKSAANFLARTHLQFLMFLQRDNVHIGNIGAFAFNWEIPAGEIGYWLRTSHTHRGLMTEAVRGLAGVLQSKFNFRRIQIRTDEHNHRSRRVAELAGFQLEGILRNDSLATGGGLRNTCVYSQIGTGSPQARE